MLRKILLILALAVPMSAALADNDVGCGAGTILWAGSSGILPKVLAATTNGVLGNQTFGISSGTLGCQQGGVVTASARVKAFAGANLDRLAANMAAGGGESLTVLADLYNINKADRPYFYRATRRHFAAIFPATDTTAGQMLAHLRTVMAGDARLARYAG